MYVIGQPGERLDGPAPPREPLARPGQGRRAQQGCVVDAAAELRSVRHRDEPHLVLSRAARVPAPRQLGEHGAGPDGLRALRRDRRARRVAAAGAAAAPPPRQRLALEHGPGQ